MLESFFQERTEKKLKNQIILRTQYLCKHLFIIIVLITVYCMILTLVNGLKVGFEQAQVWQAARL